MASVLCACPEASLLEVEKEAVVDDEEEVDSKDEQRLRTLSSSIMHV